MKLDLSVLDVDILKAMFENEEKILNKKLSDGSLEQDVVDHRKTVTEISIALHKKYNAPGKHPSEHSPKEIG